MARQMAEPPDGGPPDQAEGWSDLQAMSRLFDAEEATVTAPATPHWRRTRTLDRGPVLLIGDTTETDFGLRRAVRGLGPTGEGDGLGFFPHGSMMVDAAGGEILGLAGQERFFRKPVSHKSPCRRARTRARSRHARASRRSGAAWSSWSDRRPRTFASLRSLIAARTTSTSSAWCMLLVPAAPGPKSPCGVTSSGITGGTDVPPRLKSFGSGWRAQRAKLNVKTSVMLLKTGCSVSRTYRRSPETTARADNETPSLITWTTG